MDPERRRGGYPSDGGHLPRRARWHRRRGGYARDRAESGAE